VDEAQSDAPQPPPKAIGKSKRAAKPQNEFEKKENVVNARGSREEHLEVRNSLAPAEKKGRAGVRK